MHLDLTHIDGLAVAASSLASIVLGGLWFGAIVARPYAAALQRPDILGKAPGVLAIVGPAVCSVVVMLANAVLMPAVGVATLSDACLFGLAVGLGYLLPMVLNIAINPNMPRPFFYTAINAPYFLGSNLIGCAILHAMR